VQDVVDKVMQTFGMMNSLTEEAGRANAWGETSLI